MARQNGRLQGRVCVAAGAVGALGEGVARRFAAEGGIVVGIDRKQHAVGTLALQADLADEEQVRAAHGRINRQLKRVDVIYNNAGLVDPADHSALTSSVETWNAILAANLTTTWLSCKHGIACMLQNDPAKGSVINTASFLAGMGAASAQMAFNVAKAGVQQLSRDLGVHLARSGVRVNSLALGPIETPQLRQTFERIGPDEAARRFVHMPMGRFGTVQELAATVAYLASDDAGFVTAASFPINGGIQGAFTVAAGS
ncbi:SDR family oxidoreductase [Lichenicoccus sp.]|uniref:SDR family oxidoreductase n=1 Tax=Lichenicoccus sp. TaxID=2781899 RepID=UPI003D11F092